MPIYAVLIFQFASYDGKSPLLAIAPPFNELRIAYEYFPGKDADIINLARALKNCSALSEIIFFLHYL